MKLIAVFIINKLKEKEQVMRSNKILLICTLILCVVIHSAYSAVLSANYNTLQKITGLKTTEIDGKKCLPISTSKAVYHRYKDISRRIKVTPGQKLTLNVNIKIPKKLKYGYFVIQALFFDNKGNHFATSSSTNYNASAEWTDAKVSFLVPDKADRVLLRACNRGVGTVYIHSVSLDKATGFELAKLSGFSGTLDEKILLHSWACLTSSNLPMSKSIVQVKLPNGHTTNVLKLVCGDDKKNCNIGISGIPENKGWNEIKSRRLVRFSFYYRVPFIDGKFRARNLLLKGRHCPDNINFAPFIIDSQLDNWQKVEYTIPSGKNFSHAGFSFRLNGNGKIILEISGAEFVYDDGSINRTLQVWKDPYWYYPKLSQPHPMTASTTGKVMICGAWTLRNKQSAGMLNALKKLIPNLGIIENLNLDILLNNRKQLDDDGFALGFQNITPFLWQAAVKHDAIRYKLDTYQGLDQKYHKYDCSSPAWAKIYNNVAERFKDYGIKDYEGIDCNFTGGDADKYRMNFIHFLKQEDEGIIITGWKRIHFWDYFKAYTGTIWKPSALNWKKWDDYKHTSQGAYSRGNASKLNRMRGYLDMALVHYAYMLYNARLGRAFKKYDVDYFVMNNGDNWQNGNDWEFNARCKNIPGFVEETFFYHPSTVIKAYHQALLFRQFYNKYGTRHRLIQETGQGGHGPIYWAPLVSYAINFTLNSCQRYDSLQVDWPAESCTLVYSGTTSKTHIDRVKDFLSKVLAFNHARAFDIPKTCSDMKRVVILSETATMTAGSLNQWKLKSVITDNNYPGSYAALSNFNLDLLNNSDIIINDYYALPTGGARKLERWLNAKRERVLFLHGSSAARIINGTMWAQPWNWNRTTINGKNQFKNELGEIKRIKTGNSADMKYMPTVKGKVILAESNGSPLLSRYKLPSGSTIYYYHYIPGVNRARDSKVIANFFKSQKISRLSKNIKGHAAVNKFEYNDGSYMIAAFDQDVFKKYHFDPRVRNSRFQLDTPNENAEFEISLESGRYNSFSFINGQNSMIEVKANKKTTLKLNKKAVEIFFIVPADKPERLKQIKANRKELFDTINNITNKLK